MFLPIYLPIYLARMRAIPYRLYYLMLRCAYRIVGALYHLYLRLRGKRELKQSANYPIEELSEPDSE